MFALVVFRNPIDKSGHARIMEHERGSSHNGGFLFNHSHIVDKGLHRNHKVAVRTATFPTIFAGADFCFYGKGTWP